MTGPYQTVLQMNVLQDQSYIAQDEIRISWTRMRFVLHGPVIFGSDTRKIRLEKKNKNKFVLLKIKH